MQLYQECRQEKFQHARSKHRTSFPALPLHLPWRAVGLHQNGQAHQTTRWLMTGLIVMLLLLLPSLFLGNNVAVAASPPSLSVTPTSFAAGDSNCTANGNGWTCKATLTSTAGAQGKLNWSTSSSLAGVTFTPASGTLAPGKSAVVKVAVSLTACSSGTFTFAGPNNSVPTAWSCTPPPPSVMSVTPAKLSPTSTACTSTSGGYNCVVKVAESKTSQGPLNWSASSSLSNVMFSPASGILTPGKNVSVTISVPSCSTSGMNGSFTFAGAEGETPVVVTWQCKTTSSATLVVTPTSLDPNNAACSLSRTVIECTVTLSETANSTVKANWLANTTFSDSAVVPSSGTLAPGHSTQVVLDSLPCQNGSVTFTGSEGETPVTVTFSCTPNSLSTSPTQLDPTNTACSVSGSTYSCAVTLAETADSPGNATWTALSDMNGITFNPANGTLSPGQSITVNATGIPCQNGSLFFSGTTAVTLNAVTAWSCTPPPPPPLLFVNTSSLTPVQCGLASSVGTGTYQCSLTLTEAAYSVGAANWSANSDMGGASFNPASGTLQPGNSVTVTAYLPCQNGTVTFSGAEGETPLSVSWNGCTPSAMLLTPANIDPSSLSCSGGVFGGGCSVTLSLTGTTSIPINWTMSGDFSDVTLRPSTPTSGILGQPVTITFALLPCANRTFTFTGTNGETPVVLQWTCTPPPATLSVSDQSLAPGNADCTLVALSPAYTCNVILSAASNSGDTQWGIVATLPATISPLNDPGTISGGQQIYITIADIPCQNGTFTIYELWLTDPLVINWTCSVSSARPRHGHTAMVSIPALHMTTSFYADRRR